MLRALAKWCARLLLAGAGLVLGVWALGMLVNDRFLWSQFLWWLPTPMVATAAAALTACAWVCAWLSRTGGAPGSPGRRMHHAINATWSAVGVLMLIFLVFEARIYRAVTPSAGPANSPLRVVTWNMNTARIEDVPARVSPLAPDVLMLANRPYFGSFSDLRATVGETTSVAAGGRLAVISKHPVIASMHVPLGITGAQARTFRWQGGGMVSIDQGEALLVLLDTTQWNGSTLCVWLMDLPSDPPIPRARMMRQVRDAIEQFHGPAYLPRVNAADEAIIADADLRAKLMTPDVVSGDLNTPRHSWSISRVLAPGMRYAPDQAGDGWRMTFPAGVAVLAIDNTLLSERVGCYYYGVHELSTRQRDHAAQLTVLTPAQ